MHLDIVTISWYTRCIFFYGGVDMFNKNFKKNMTRVAAGLLSAGMLLGSSLTANANGLYISELTGLPISTTIQNQRPIAVMVDNEKTALQHYGTAEADIVY